MYRSLDQSETLRTFFALFALTVLLFCLTGAAADWHLIPSKNCALCHLSQHSFSELPEVVPIVEPNGLDRNHEEKKVLEAPPFGRLFFINRAPPLSPAGSTSLIVTWGLQSLQSAG